MVACFGVGFDNGCCGVQQTEASGVDERLEALVAARIQSLSLSMDEKVNAAKAAAQSQVVSKDREIMEERQQMEEALQREVQLHESERKEALEVQAEKLEEEFNARLAQRKEEYELELTLINAEVDRLRLALGEANTTAGRFKAQMVCENQTLKLQLDQINGEVRMLLEANARSRAHVSDLQKREEDLHQTLAEVRSVSEGKGKRIEQQLQAESATLPSKLIQLGLVGGRSDGVAKPASVVAGSIEPDTKERKFVFIFKGPGVDFTVFGGGTHKVQQVEVCEYDAERKYCIVHLHRNHGRRPVNLVNIVEEYNAVVCAEFKVELCKVTVSNGKLTPALYLFKEGCVSPPLLAKIKDDRLLQSPNYQMWRNPLRNPVAAGVGRVVTGAPVVAAVRVEEEEGGAAAGGGGVVEEEVAENGGVDTEEDDN